MELGLEQSHRAICSYTESLWWEHVVLTINQSPLAAAPASSFPGTQNHSLGTKKQPPYFPFLGFFSTHFGYPSTWNPPKKLQPEDIEVGFVRSFCSHGHHT